MKKALLMNVLYKPNIGGVENSISEIAKELMNNGYKVDILCSNRNNENKKHLEHSTIINGANVYRYNNHFDKFSFIKNILESKNLIKNLKESEEYSLIISRSYFLVISSVLAGLKDINYIPPEVSYYSNKGTKSVVSPKQFIAVNAKLFLQWFALMTSKNVFVFSQSMFNQVKGFSLGKVLPSIVNPGINLERFSMATLTEKEKLKEIYNIPKDKKAILALGRFSEIKQFDIAIKSMAILSDEYFLVLVGSGPELKHYQSIITSNNLQHKVKIFDATSSPEEFYKLADAFLMTSRYESFGQTILEACVSGLQIISFNRKSGVNTNIESMLKNCKGVYFVEEQSSAALAKVIEKSLENNLGLQSIFSHNQKLLESRYSWSRFVSTIEGRQ
ncbi:glycosyltransferase [Psychrobacter sp. DM8]|uniref:glycosyltransferase n=1 Tax=Psychrobacter sp. DM8 TaxID=3440636 RepID=UPI003F505834